jgi:hypothetical protein
MLETKIAQEKSEHRSLSSKSDSEKRFPQFFRLMSSQEQMLVEELAGKAATSSLKGNTPFALL